jgi:hypothetical protein
MQKSLRIVLYRMLPSQRLREETECLAGFQQVEDIRSCWTLRAITSPSIALYEAQEGGGEHTCSSEAVKPLQRAEKNGLPDALWKAIAAMAPGQLTREALRPRTGGAAAHAYLLRLEHVG